MKKDKIVAPIVLVLLVGLFPYYFLFLRNIGKIKFEETLSVLIILVVASLFLLGLVYFLVKDIYKASIITSIFSIILLYFEKFVSVTTKLLPFFYYWHILYIGLVLLLLVAAFISKKISRENAIKLNNSLLVVSVGLFLLNFVLAVPSLHKELLMRKDETPTTASEQGQSQQVIKEEILPNVYYLIFDEYGGPNNLLRYCDYDNTPFYDHLGSIGFVSSKTSLNDTIDTITEIPNLLQLDRVNTIEMTALEKKENFKNPRLVKLMKDFGYSINLLDSTNYQFLDVSVADYHFTSEFTSTYRTFDSYVWENSIIYPFYGKQDQDQERAKILRMFEYVSESPNLQANNLFTIGYFEFPHFPYIFDQDGNKAHYSDRSNIKDPKPYLDQLIYANKLISQLVTDILDADPSSVIIIQSDHGLRLASHLYYWYGIHTYDPTQETEFEHNILNLVYYPSEKIEIEGLNGLDTLKKVFSLLLEVEIN